MKTSWLGQRKDFFVSNLVQDFFAARKYFDEMLEHYKNNDSLPYSMLAVWVGSDTDKGPLWQLKEHSHRLYRSNRSKTILFENLFDWVVGSIFHESMKLKEDIYQIESYKPLLEMGLSDNAENREIAKIIREYYALIDRAIRSLREEIESIDELFTKGLLHLRALIVFYKDNALLLRFLVDNKKITETMFGHGALQQILHEMFPAGIHEAYMLISESCMRNGWYDEARKHLETAMKIGAAHRGIPEHLAAKPGHIAEKELESC